ncbi:MAG: drug efflux system protein MdtG [Verrucomicrobia bacterium ADurb.Bin018]|jgi:DHA1 family multidrug resistance protein-like MFS transporter|nr:MAG: drug efflux system protein MdtG [Verrucomicrobia bacterium ADurb.Bin018]
MTDSWKKQMALVWASQFLSIMGFSFALPFAPYFLQQELGVITHAALQMWVALFSSSAAVTMAIAAPLWGVLADRYGKRIMLIRANLAGAVVMSLMGTVHTPLMLIVLRLMQGALTGTMTAAQAFLAGEMPRERRGLAVGGLSAAVFSGSMAGAFCGGFVAHWAGYRAAFGLSGILLLLAGLLVLCCTRETVVPAARAGRLAGQQPAAPRRAPLPAMLYGVLGMIGAIAFVRQFDLAFVPLLVQDIHGSLEGVSLWSGALNACGSVAGLLAGLATGWLADRVNPLRVVIVAAMVAAVFSGWQMVVHSFVVLFPIRFGNVFFAGALEPALNAWLAKHVPESRQGVIFGLASTTRSIGWTIGPLVAGSVALVSLRGVFGFSALGFLVLALLFAVGLRRRDETATKAP